MGQVTPLPGGTTPQDLAGTDKTFAPDWQFSHVARWEDFIGSDFRYFLRGEWLYTGEQNIGGNQNNNPQTIQDGYSLVNAGAGFGAADRSWTFDVYVKNITNADYYSVLFDQPFGEQLGAVDAALGTSVQRGVLVAPRTYGARLRFTF
jgi:iron complex outermembrane recepter protein